MKSSKTQLPTEFGLCADKSLSQSELIVEGSFVRWQCGWQLHKSTTAVRWWQKQVQQVAECLSASWFHQVDFAKQIATFRYDNIRLQWRVNRTPVIDSNLFLYSVIGDFQVSDKSSR
ncbi:MAG: hypothetical protein AAGB12_00685 [Pseudomonadota bacterium]